MDVPLIAEIRRDALDDGPGIRSVVFFKGCGLSCAWCHNPECISTAPEIVFRAERCLGCGACIEACVHGALDERGPAARDRARCQRCGACADACPALATELVGRRHPVGELAALLLRDEILYRNSGGGVTLSGGEPALYARYAGELARALRTRGVHVLLETAGHFAAGPFEEHLLPWLDEIWFDLKLLDSGEHRRLCGAANERVLANLEHLLARSSPPVLVRIPLVPGVTGTDGNLRAAAGWLERHGVRRVALVPYNPLWIPKSRSVGRAPASLPERWMSAEELAAAKGCFEGFEVLGV